MKNLILALFTAFLAICCNKPEYAVPSMMEKNNKVDANIVFSEPHQIQDKITSSAVQKENEVQDRPQDSIGKKIIKNGAIALQVGNLSDAKKEIMLHVLNTKSYLQNETFQNSEIAEETTMVIRIPNQNFDKFMDGVSKGIGELISKEISTDDVSEEYFDISIRLNNKKIYLEKYRELLRRSASTKDMLEIQEKIRGLEEEIETSVGRLKYMDDRVKYSTLRVTITKEKPRTSITSKLGFGSRFVDALAEGWNNFVGFVLGLVSFWPFLFVLPALIFLWKKLKMRNKKL